VIPALAYLSKYSENRVAAFFLYDWTFELTFKIIIIAIGSQIISKDQ
jgi:hypothetical protein